jgi:ribosomal protein S18 acetylase RimI-like enzyme
MIILEPITPPNAMLFKDIRLGALQDSPTAFSSTYAEESQLTDADWFKRAAQWSSEKSVGYLAMDARISCGIASGLLDQVDATRAHLLSMWVAPTHRRLGIGRMLVDAVAAWARAQDAQSLWLLVTSNNDRAIRFYQGVGFALTGRTEPYRNDPSLFNYEMRRLSPEDRAFRFSANVFAELAQRKR